MLQDIYYFPVIQKKCQELILFGNNINVRRINLAIFKILDYCMNLQVLSQLIALTLIILSGPIVIAVLAFKKASAL
uniref:Photosystem II reaction center protein Psb30 n=9 Tax=Monodopsidaceae TaxID=425072 RepID=A0A023PK42_9STRA|nr:photosystem II protein psb30 [Nannochloropsis gaditana]AHX25471.1 photosystem II protein psb30 [Microchloropsis salina]